MEKEDNLGIAKRYSLEIQDIANKLRDLENGRVYELTGARMDGSLATNTQQLRTMISGLLSKVDKQHPSIDDELATLFEKGLSDNN